MISPWCILMSFFLFSLLVCLSLLKLFLTVINAFKKIPSYYLSKRCFFYIFSLIFTKAIVKSVLFSYSILHILHSSLYLSFWTIFQITFLDLSSNSLIQSPLVINIFFISIVVIFICYSFFFSCRSFKNFHFVKIRRDSCFISWTLWF